MDLDQRTKDGLGSAVPLRWMEVVVGVFWSWVITSLWLGLWDHSAAVVRRYPCGALNHDFFLLSIRGSKFVVR